MPLSSSKTASKNRLRGGQEGIALISVMWFVLLLSLLVGSVLASVRTVYVSENARLRVAMLKHAAEGAIHRLIYETLTKGALEVAARRYELGGIRVAIDVEHEAGKIDVNRADPELMQSLLETFGLDSDRARSISEAIADWRDPDSVKLPMGAEATEYNNIIPRDGPFLTLPELQQVRGMTPELYSCVAPYLTIYTGSAVPDLSVASNKVREALNEEGSRARQGTSILNQGPVFSRSIYLLRASARDQSGSEYYMKAVVRMRGSGSEPFWVHAWGQASGADCLGNSRTGEN